MDADFDRRHAAIARWLLIVCAFIFLMVVIGGLTRLTESGLSIVEWKPLTGWMPPVGDAAWQGLFQKYQTSPEYQKINRGMSLDQFKGIFWLEFAHRLWGRL
ncbi:MAG: heme A synthase, partial [Alphaproteobacteria bacterium]|nr:heme A synthase [Alphaproteobacteria bacterium]